VIGFVLLAFKSNTRTHGHAHILTLSRLCLRSIDDSFDLFHASTTAEKCDSHIAQRANLDYKTVMPWHRHTHTHTLYLLQGKSHVAFGYYLLGVFSFQRHVQFCYFTAPLGLQENNFMSNGIVIAPGNDDIPDE
jgi:diadenosine tetraphosphatase ApaH/serine/threonine PP2A family protein phosphatase